MLKRSQDLADSWQRHTELPGTVAGVVGRALIEQVIALPPPDMERKC